MALRRFALIFGIVFLIVGAGGFIPGLVAPHSHPDVTVTSGLGLELSLFPINVLHNIVHLLFGIAGLALARTVSGARNYLVVGGIVYLVLFVYGLVVSQDSAANFVPVNTADDVLHLVLGLGMIGLGVALTRRRAERAATV
jgi:hypothetical protein